MWYVGADVHLRSSSVCVLDGQGQRIRQKTIRGPWPELVAWLKDLTEPIPIGEWYLRLTVAEFADHYHLERNHQELGNRLIVGEAEAEPVTQIESGTRSSGILRSYHRAA